MVKEIIFISKKKMIDWLNVIQENESSLSFLYLLQILFVLNGAMKQVKVNYCSLIPCQKNEILKWINALSSLPLKIHFFDNKDFLMITRPDIQPKFQVYPKNTMENHRIINIIEKKTRRIMAIKYSKINQEINIQKKIVKYDQIMKQIGLPYRFVYQVYSRKIFYEKYKDKVFVSNYIQEYSEILKDEFLERTRFSNPSLILEKWNAFQWIMEMITQGDILKIYQNIIPDSKQYLEMQKLLLQLEEEMLKTTC
jgi:hypothetical protein